MKKKLFAAGIIFCISIQLLCACGRQEQTVPRNIHIGVTYYNQSDTFLNELLACFREQLDYLEREDCDITMTIRDAAGSQRTQDDQVASLITEGCDILCVNLVDRADPSEIIDVARENDVPIIFFNREPVAEDLKQWDKLYYVGADAKQSGVMQGELAVDIIQENSRIDRNKDGKIQYVVLEGEAGHQDAIIRTESVVDTLKNSGIELEKLSWQIANWNRAQAQNRMTQMIGQYQTEIELVLANNDDMALGAIDAYEKTNFTESALPVFLGIDGTDAGLQAILDSKLAGTVYNDKEGQAEAMARLAVAIASGEGMEEIEFENDKYIYLPYSKVTSENVQSYLEKNSH
jgi:methyl-galactoside transport system substrate-binding protein